MWAGIVVSSCSRIDHTVARPFLRGARQVESEGVQAQPSTAGEARRTVEGRTPAATRIGPPSATSWPPAAPGSAPSRSGSRPAECSAVFPDCVARKSQSPPGVSTDWYTRLEKGHIRGVSDGVLSAVARALRLDDAETAHLFHLARAAKPARTPRRRTPAKLLESRQQLLDAMSRAAALIRNGRLDIIATNALGRGLYAPVLDEPAWKANAPPTAGTRSRWWANSPRAVEISVSGGEPMTCATTTPDSNTSTIPWSERSTSATTPWTFGPLATMCWYSTATWPLPAASQTRSCACSPAGPHPIRRCCPKSMACPRLNAEASTSRPASDPTACFTAMWNRVGHRFGCSRYFSCSAIISASACSFPSAHASTVVRWRLVAQPFVV
ncbi:putative transcriptional regulator [Mycobacterium marinum MB2]|nr:putative transcriptional regulator [Mycobacterium marinum MB2]